MAHDRVYGICENKCMVLMNGVVNVMVPSTAWRTENNVRTKEVTVPGMKSSMRPFIDLDMSRLNDLESLEQAQKDYGLILKVESLDGKIKVYASKMPEISFYINIACPGLGEE